MCLYLILQKCKYKIVDLVSFISHCPFFFFSSVKPFKNLLYTIEARAEVRVALGHHNIHVPSSFGDAVTNFLLNVIEM